MPPPGWGDDALTAFLDMMRSNQLATYHNKRPAVQKLIDIDKQFQTVAHGWLNPHCELAAALLIRCNASFRGAAGLAMAGQCVEAYQNCRAALEFAAYAVAIHKTPALGVVWLQRHQNDVAKATQLAAFSHRKVLAAVTAANRDAGVRFETLYQKTIDLGGHPNEMTVTANLKIKDAGDRREMLNIQLHADGVQLAAALKIVAQCGLTSLEMLQVVFNARFELLGVNAKMLELRKGL